MASEGREVTFPSGDATCAGLHLRGRSTTAEPRPCVVMAHGFGGTVDGGILGFAEGFAAAGLDVLVFDYRGFGRSGGSPRQLVSYRRQRVDYHSAIRAARSIEGVDPAQIIVWGTSYSGGHVLAVAADDPRVAAVVSMTPSTDGLATLRHLARAGGPGPVVRLAWAGVRDSARAAFRRAPRLVPILGPGGSNAVMAKDGALESMAALAGPTWRNEVCARVALEIAFNRPARSVHRLRAPLLVQAGDHDTVVPAAAALAAADRAGGHAEALRYPVDHFDVYDGPWQARLLSDQVDFLDRNLRGADQDLPVTA
jgi:uncharacterized protein